MSMNDTPYNNNMNKAFQHCVDFLEALAAKLMKACIPQIFQAAKLLCGSF